MMQDTFSDTWEMANTTLVHKKETKTFLENYASMNLLPIFDKFFKDY